MLSLLLLCNAIFFLFLGVIWVKTSWLNLFLILGLLIANAIAFLYSNGYIIQGAN